VKVCILTTSFPRFKGDSAGIFIYHLSAWLAQKGIQVHVIAPGDPVADYFEYWDNIHIYRFPYFFPLKYQRLCYGDGLLNNLRNSRLALMQAPFFILVEFFYLLYTLKKKKIDLIHAHWSLPQGLLGIMAKYALKIPCVTTLHGSDIFGLRHPLLRSLNKLSIAHSDVCTANSRATAAMARKISGLEKPRLIPMGVNPVQFQKSTEVVDLRKKLQLNGEVILSVGRLIDLKGTDYLIKALARVLLEFPRAKAIIIGSGPRKNYLHNLTRDLQLSENIIFIDKVSQNELVKYYSIADVFVLPSIKNKTGEIEGFGVVLLEAMACGLAVIGSRVGGIPDIIKDEETGLLARPKNSRHLSEQIIRLLSDDHLRKTLALKAQRLIAKKFSWEIIAGRFIEIYQEVLIDE
jgi:glycosyltransferase involved in cell wall biosynthesis